ncbi:MAG TPA: adenylosuccinate lyase [Deinococcales bacterium]|nr:adenylosuccinate lyase [Deinococcales bacterium]
MIERYQTPEMAELWSEANRYRVWLEVELAATDAWAQLGDVPPEAARTLREIAAAKPLDEGFARRVAEIEAVTRHDIVAFTTALSERFGDPARFVHLGLTSTDVVDTAQNLLLVRALDIILADVRRLRDACRDKAVEHKHTPTIGRTHGIHAEPMTFGLKFLNFHAALTRDLERLTAARERVRVAMLSGSVGTYAHVSPAVEERVARSLGLVPDPITNQTVARDRHAEVMSALAILGTSLERIAVEIRHLQRTEVREAMEAFSKGQKGSSSMPHKKNPIASENISGLARLMRSNLQAALEDVVLWHERDISHSSVERVILPDTTTVASYATRRLAGLVENLVVFPERMLANLDLLGGLVFSQRVLHQLIEHGMSREAAYEVVQRNSLKSWESGEPLRALLESDPANPLGAAELDAAFDLRWYLREVDGIYERAGL